MASEYQLKLGIVAAAAAYKCFRDGYMGEERYNVRFRGKNFSEHFRDAGYGMFADRAPGRVKESGFGGLALEPVAKSEGEPCDESAPIILAFRGTVDGEDVKEDIKGIGLTSHVSQAYRDEAFNLYEEARAKYPGRKLIMVGHSLGGYLAQDVAVRASQQVPADTNFEVVTFNSAPYKDRAGLEAIAHRFSHYRQPNDLVSHGITGGSLGTAYTIQSRRSTSHEPLPAHSLVTMMDDFPPRILHATMGSLGLRVHSLAEEYQTRVKKQFFGHLRDGQRKAVVISDCCSAIQRILDDRSGDKKLRVLKLLTETETTLETEFGATFKESAAIRVMSDLREIVTPLAERLSMDSELILDESTPVSGAGYSHAGEDLLGESSRGAPRG